MSRRAVLLTLASGILGTALGGARPAVPGDDGALAPRGHAVTMRGFAFVPQRLSVALGDTIIWINEDIVVHTVTADTLELDSGDIAGGKQYRIVAAAKGTLSYHCELHPAMKGVLVVQ